MQLGSQFCSVYWRYSFSSIWFDMSDFFAMKSFEGLVCFVVQSLIPMLEVVSMNAWHISHRFIVVNYSLLLQSYFVFFLSKTWRTPLLLQLVMTGVAVIVIDRLGRRPLLLGGVSGMVCPLTSSIFLFFFSTISTYSPSFSIIWFGNLVSSYSQFCNRWSHCSSLGPTTSFIILYQLLL